jgi:hypothetical protein
MPEFIVGTPLKHSVASQPYAFADGISIQKVSPILWDIFIARGYISQHDRDYLSEDRFWLCAKAEAQSEHDGVAQQLYEKARQAAYALQIIAPCGGKNVYLQFRNTGKGFDNVGACHPHEACVTLLGKSLRAERLGLAGDFEKVYAGVRRAFTEKVVRIQNPILLLEHAQQIGNIPLAATMCTMGLDMLFMAGKINPFVSRLGGFLGLDTFVFPSYGFDCEPPHQPAVRVREVLADVYLFRNIIAHGHEIPKTPWRQPQALLTTEGHSVNYEPIYRVDLMLESSLFFLTTALRKTLTENLFEDVADTNKWRAKLKVYEHRYKDAGGAEISER